jgi:oligogalacturonide lyase
VNPTGSGKGRTWPSEGRWLRDETTGARIRQVTTHPSIHHHPFFFVPPYDDAMRRLVFVSHRTGRPQLFAPRSRRAGGS